MNRTRTYIKRFLLTVVILAALFVALIFSVYIPFVQQFIVSKIEHNIADGLDADVSIGYFDLSFFAVANLDRIQIIKQNDTLLMLEKVSVDIKFKPLLDHKVVINNIELTGLNTQLDQLIGYNDTTSAPEDAATTDGQPWEIQLNHVSIFNSNLALYDEELDMDLQIEVGQGSIGKLSIDSFVYRANDIRLENSRVSYVSPYTLDEVEDTSVINFIFATNKVVFINSEFYYNDSLMSFVTGGKYATADSLWVNVGTEKVSMKYAEMDNSYFNFVYINDTLETPYIPLLWQVTIDKAKISNSQFIYDIPYLPENTEEFDYNHIHFTEMSAEAEGIFYSEPKIYLNLLSGSLNENNRVQIEKSSGKLFMDTTEIVLSNLLVETDNGRLGMNGSLGYNVIDFDFRDNGKLDLLIQYQTKQSNNWHDLDYFAGDYINEIPNLKKVRNKPLEISNSVKGYYDNLQITTDLVYDKNTKFKGEASIENATKDYGFKYNMEIANLELPKASVGLFVDQDELEYVPKKSRFKGTIQGTEKATMVKGALLTDYGSQNLVASVDLSDSIPIITTQFSGSINAGKFYNFRVDTLNFDGYLQGTEVAQMLANAEVKMHGIHIDSLYYDSAYVNLNLEDQQYLFTVNSFDEHADFDLNSQGSVNDTMISSQMYFDIAHISFKEKQLFKSPEILQLKSKINLQFNFNTYASMLDANIRDIVLSDSNETDKIKKLDIDFKHFSKHTSFDFVSDENTIKIDIDGNLDTLTNNIQKFIDILVLEERRPEHDSLNFPNISIYANINNPYEFLGSNISDSIPHFSSLFLTANYKNTKHHLDMQLLVPSLVYQSNVFDSIDFRMKGDLQGFNYAFRSDILLDSILNIQAKVEGNFKNRKLLTHINISDRNRIDFIDLKLLSQETKLGYMLSIMDDTLTILSNRWHVNQPNSLELEKGNIIAKGIAIHRADKDIKIETNNVKKEIALTLKNIELAVFNRVLSNDSMLSGYTNSKLSASFQQGTIDINFLAHVDSFKYENQYLGDIDIHKAHINAQQLVFDSELSTNTGFAKAKGSMKFNDAKDLDINVKILNLNLDFLNSSMGTYLYDVKGSINSDLHISGNMDLPKIDGYFQFKDSQFGLRDLNEVFRLNTAKIRFENNKIYPEKLVIMDHNNHKASLTGNLDFNNGNLLFHNFHIKSDGLELMNVSKQDNEMLNGLVMSSFDINLDGAIDDLNAISKVEIDYPTVVNYTFPEDLSVSNNDGIVNFNKVDTLTVTDSLLINELKRRNAHLMDIFRYLDAELIVKDGCKFNVYFDNTGDNSVKVTVNGDIKYHFSDETILTSGMLNIVKGKMNYSMPMVSMKELEVGDDSYIQITNDVSNPYISINASSKIWAQTGDLVENYNRNLEVTVLVYMRGTLDNLIVQFDVSPETSDALISSKISQMTEKERTMNAVNLLIRGQFASKQNTMTIDMNSYVNTIIAKALNKLISDRVKFVDMSFDIKSFNNIKSNGAVESQSNLFFNVGKSFYHDRLRINYRSNMTSSVTQQAGQYGSTDSYTERNFTIEYDINKSGNFQGVLFRKDSYEDIMEGDITSTGGGIRIRKNYDTFADIFRLKSYKRQKNE